MIIQRTDDYSVACVYARVHHQRGFTEIDGRTDNTLNKLHVHKIWARVSMYIYVSTYMHNIHVYAYYVRKMCVDLFVVQ